MSNFRRRLMMNAKDPLAIPSSKAIAGDIAFFNKKLEKIVILPYEIVSDTNWPAKYRDMYDVIGIVVVPGAHNVYKNGKCGIMSVKDMAYYDPDNGYNGYVVRMYWGADQLLDSNFIYYYVNVNNNNPEDGSCERTFPVYRQSVYLPVSARTTIKECKHDKLSYYANLANNYIVSPYLLYTNNDIDNKKNPAYSQTTEPSNELNALSDFNGLNNTTKILKYATAQPNWKTEPEIINSYSEGYFTAACCCWRYHINHTKQGDWYLPAIGELGYMASRSGQIQSSLKLLENIYGDIVFPLTISQTDNYWSSTPYENGGYMYYYSSCNYDGKISTISPINMHHVRAFMQI